MNFSVELFIPKPGKLIINGLQSVPRLCIMILLTDLCVGVFLQNGFEKVYFCAVKNKCKLFV